jgi:hypothetical protein
MQEDDQDKIAVDESESEAQPVEEEVPQRAFGPAQDFEQVQASELLQASEPVQASELLQASEPVQESESVKASQPVEASTPIPDPIKDPDLPDPPVKEPPVQDPPLRDPPAEDPPLKDPPAHDPPVEDPPTQAPPGLAPSGQAAPIQASSGQGPHPQDLQPYPVRIHSRLRQQAPPPASAQGSDAEQQPMPSMHVQVSHGQPSQVGTAQIGAPQIFELQPFQEPPVDKEQQYIDQQEQLLSQPDGPAAAPVKACRHEYVRIFQRKLKDLNRRMVCTKAYLPVGFKMGDFGHLGENSFCFCATCRARLYPKRSQAEKAEARVQLAQGKALKLEQSLLSADLIEEVGSKALAQLLMRVDDNEDDEPEEIDDDNVAKVDIHVEEMEQEAVGVEDIDVESLNANPEEDSCELSDQEEN